MSTLHVSLFGKLEVRYGEHRLIALDTHNAQKLFCYLLIFRDRPHTRESLANVLWGDQSAAHSKNYLRKALWQLQATLDEQADAARGQLLLLDGDWVQLHPQADVWLDVAVLERAAAVAHGTPGRNLPSEIVQTLRDAAALYRGELLDGWYHDWCLYERERFQHKYLMILDKLMDYHEATHQFDDALLYGECILRYDRARERTHRHLMRLYYLAGDRTAALRQYERCAVALREELSVAPAERTVQLRALIIADRPDELAQPPATVEAAARTTADPLPELLSRLRQFQTVLVNVQQQLQQQIWTVETTLSHKRH